MPSFSENTESGCSFGILPEVDPTETVIRVIGVGGGGGNAVNHMVDNNAANIEFIAANTDHQALVHSRANVTIQLGSTGLGAGSKPEIGAAAAEEKRQEITEALRGTNLLFITAGMGGGTGTGASPVIADIAKELGILTVAVVTKPFSFEGGRRMRLAEKGIEALRDKVDSMIVILNEKLETVCSENATMSECFAASNDVLYKACVGIADVIHTPGVINVDFEDVKTVMSIHGTAIIGMATASGPDRARVAAEAAVSCPLLEGSNLQGARGLLAYFTGDESVTLAEIRQAMAILNNFTQKSAEIIFGSACDKSMGENLRVTLVATGLDEQEEPAAAAPQGMPSFTPQPVSRPAPAEAAEPAAPERAPAERPRIAAVGAKPAFTVPSFLKTGR